MTAEPRGAYHLEPLFPHLRNRSEVEFLHLTPYHEPVQGRAWDDTVADSSVIDTADRMIITGGELSAWTALALRRAAQVQIEVRYSELAFVREPAPAYGPPAWPSVTAASAQSPGSAPLIAAMFPTAAVEVLGVPQLDGAGDDDSDPDSARVLLLSRSSDDPQEWDLQHVAELLCDHGLEPVIRCHPREDRERWRGYEVDDSASLLEAARGTRAVCGYPGTALSLLASAGHPATALEVPGGLAVAVPEHQRQVVQGRAGDPHEALMAILARRVAPRPARELAAGTQGGAGARTVQFWAA